MLDFFATAFLAGCAGFFSDVVPPGLLSALGAMAEEYVESKYAVKKQEALLNQNDNGCVTEIRPRSLFCSTRIALTGAVRSRSGANFKGT